MKKILFVFFVLSVSVAFAYCDIYGAKEAGYNPNQHYINKKSLLPASYSSLEEGYSSPVRSQSPYGCCWAFSACAAMETYARKNGNFYNLVFSPLHLVSNVPYPYVTLSSGGNLVYVMAYLTGLKGPVEERFDPYEAPFVSVYFKEPAGYCNNAYILTDSERGLCSEEINAIKEKVYDWGAAEICLYCSNEFFTYDSINYNCPNPYQINHAVTIVGWDDNYSRMNFKDVPEDDGAFLIKNSWGKLNHNMGYFWLSYYDASLLQSAAYDFVDRAEAKYSDQMTYLTGAAIDQFSARYGKVVYEGKTDGIIYALRSYISEGNSVYNFKIYINGQEKSQALLPGEFPGFSTVYFDSPAEYKKGDKITVICDFDYSEKGYSFPMPVQGIYEGLLPILTENTNFYSGDGYNYTDIKNNKLSVGISLLTEKYGIFLDMNEAEWEIGDVKYIGADIKTSDEKSLIWSADKPDVISFEGDNSGCSVKCLKSGTVTLKAALKNNPNVYDECEIIVKEPFVKVESVSFAENPVCIGVGEIYTLKAKVLPENATDKSLLWKSSNKSIVQVKPDGRIKGIKAGKAKIYVRSNNGGMIASCKIEVKNILPESLKLNKKELKLYTGYIYQLEYKIYPENTSDKNIKWVSSDNNTVAVNSQGKIKCLKKGKATVTAKCGGVSAVCKVYIKNVIPESIEIINPPDKIRAGNSVVLKTKIIPDNSTVKITEWRSSDTKILKADSTGKITGIKAGTATVYVRTVEGKKIGSCKIRIYEVLPEAIKLEKNEMNLYAGDIYQLNYKIYPSDTTDKTVRWTSSDKKIIAVNSQGKIKCLKKGEAVITGKCRSVCAECKVTVRNIIPKSIEIVNPPETVKAGESLVLKTLILPENTTVKSVEWKSSNTPFLEVDKNGRITGIKPGNATVYVRTVEGNVSAKCKIKVVK